MARTGTAKMPSSPDGLAELLSDPKAAAEQLGTSVERMQQFQDEYARKMNPHYDAELAEAKQQGLFEFLRENGAATGRPNLAPANASSGGRRGLYSKRAPGNALNGMFTDVAEFMQVIRHDRDQSHDAKFGELRNAMGSTVPADGGFLVPETFRSDVLMSSLESSIVRPRATVIPMSSLTTQLPAVDDTSHASSVFGGFVGAWTEEGASLSITDPKFQRIKLEAKKLTAYTEVPNELVADGAGLGGFLDAALPATISFFEDDAFLTGSGVGEPLGILDSAAAVTVTRDAASKVKLVDIAAMFSRMLPSSLNRAVWICSPAVIAQLLQLALENVGGTDNVGAPPLWLSMGSIAGAPTMSLLGRPLIVSEKVPDLNTAGDLTFVDLSYYLIGDRMAMSAMQSQDYKFQNDVTAYRIIERVDGRCWLQSAITPKNGGSTLSPVVKLD